MIRITRFLLNIREPSDLKPIVAEQFMKFDDFMRNNFKPNKFFSPKNVILYAILLSLKFIGVTKTLATYFLGY